MSILSVLAEILIVGHSLVGPNLPPMIAAAFGAQGADVQVQAQIINGAPLKYQWDNSALAEGVDARAVLALGKTDTLVLTEAIPLAGAVEWNDSVGQVATFAGLAWEARPDTRVYIYETWHSLNSGPGAVVKDDPGAGVPWRERLVADLPLWQGLTVAANAARPTDAPPVTLIPAGQAMGLAADAAAAGKLPGVDDIRDLFVDDVHPNGKGLYLVAMVHLATISGKNPEGLPARLTRRWQSRDAVITDELALALQQIAWQAAQEQTARDALEPVVAPTPEPETPEPETAEPETPKPETEPAPPAPPAALTPEPPPVVQPETAFAPIANPSLALGLNGINDWSVQQPFLDVMKTARPWTGHFPNQWGGMDHTGLAAGGWLDDNGWPKALPPEITAVSTLILTDLPDDAGGVAGRYVLAYEGKGDLKIEGRAQNITPTADGVTFDYTPGEGAVLLTLSNLDPQDPIRNITVVRADREAAFQQGQIFNPDWLARIRGVKAIRFMDWMVTNDSTLSRVADSPKPDDYTWARNGVPVEIMVALANELKADPWFTLPHLASDDLIRLYAQVARDVLDPTLRAHVEYSNEVWNGQFAQGRWAQEQAKARWGQDGAGVQFYALRAAEVADIWAQVFGDQAEARLVRVVATQTGFLGLEEGILNAPLVVAEGKPAPAKSFDAYAVTGYFAALLGSEAKLALMKEWLAASMEDAGAKADAQGLTGAARDAFFQTHRFDLAIEKAAIELGDGSLSGLPDDTLTDLLTRVWPHHAAVAKTHDLQLVMYEGGTHVVGLGPLMEDAELTAFFGQLNFSPAMGALYERLLNGWAGLTDAPFNAFVDVSRSNKWGSWGALRHLGDDNPRWQALARGCTAC